MSLSKAWRRDRVFTAKDRRQFSQNSARDHFLTDREISKTGRFQRYSRVLSVRNPVITFS